MSGVIVLLEILGVLATTQTSECGLKTAEADYYVLKNDLQTAERTLKKAVEICDQMPVKSGRQNFVLGNIYVRQKRYDEAIVELKKALKIEPKLEVARLNLGGIYYTSGQYQLAIEELQKILKTKDRQLLKDALFNLGLSHLAIAVETKNQNDRKAEVYFRQAIVLDPTFAEGHYYLGVVEKNLKGNMQAANSHFRASCTLGLKLACESEK